MLRKPALELQAAAASRTLEEAEAMAVDALVTAMDFYFEDRREVAKPSAALEGERLVELPLSVSTKVELLNLVVRKKAQPIDIARTMGIKPQEVTRILNLHHATKIDTLASAFNAVGYRLELKVSKAYGVRPVERQA